MGAARDTKAAVAVPLGLVGGGSALARLAADAVAHTGGRVALVDATGTPGIALVDAAAVPAAELDALCRRSRVVAVTGDDGLEQVALFERHAALQHVCVRSDDASARLLGVTLAKLAGAPPWGIAPYVATGAPRGETVLSDYDGKRDAIAAVQAFAASLGAFAELPAMAATITSELLMNGMFNAPWDPRDGRAKYADRARDAALRLEPGEEVTLRWAADDELLVVSLADNFGRLDRATLVASLARSARPGEGQIRRATAGAGVGLFMLLNAASQLDVHVAPGRCTEVCAVVRLSRRFKDFAHRGHALNFFLAEA